MTNYKLYKYRGQLRDDLFVFPDGEITLIINHDSYNRSVRNLQKESMRVDGNNVYFIDPETCKEVSLKQYMSWFFCMKNHRYDEPRFVLHNLYLHRDSCVASFNELYNSLIEVLCGHPVQSNVERRPDFYIELDDEYVYIRTPGDSNYIPLAYLARFDDLINRVKTEEAKYGLEPIWSNKLLNSKQFVVGYINNQKIKRLDTPTFDVTVNWETGYPVNYTFNNRGCYMQGGDVNNGDVWWKFVPYIKISENGEYTSIEDVFFSPEEFDYSDFVWSGPDHINTLDELFDYIKSNLKVLEW